MRPRAHTIIAFLFLGALFSVLTAWTFELTTATQCVDLTDEAARTRRPFSVEGAWNNSTRAQEAQGFGRTTIWCLGGGAGDVCVPQAGWPLRSMQYQYDEFVPATWPGAGAARYRAAINTEPHGGVPRALAKRPLPVRPMWLGFAVDT